MSVTYYTYKSQAEAALLPGQTVKFEKGKGYYDSPPIPASYFTGPLGKRNLIPAKAGAFLIDWYGGIGTTWQQAQTAILQRQTDLGRKFDGLGVSFGTGTYGGVANCFTPPETDEITWIHQQGSFPCVSWTPSVTITAMNSGAIDGCFKAVADYLKTFPFTIMLRFDFEFNGPDTYASAEPNPLNDNVNSCGAPFIAAWQRLVEIFQQQQGATNVGFWWVPGEGGDRACINESYPGDAYVDWVGSDTYNFSMVGGDTYSTPLHPGWATFGEMFDYYPGTNQNQHDLWGPRKPFVVGETGTVYDPSYPSYKGAWYEAIPSAAKAMTHLRGIEFFDQDLTPGGVGPDWRVDYPVSDPSVYAGFKKLASSPWFNTAS